MVLSGLQKEVLALYRSILREAVRKDRDFFQSSGHYSFTSFLSNRAPRNELGSTTTSYAAKEFRRQASSVKRSDFKRIEYMIRKGQKQIKLMKMPGVLSIGGIR